RVEDSVGVAPDVVYVRTETGWLTVPRVREIGADGDPDRAEAPVPRSRAAVGTPVADLSARTACPCGERLSLLSDMTDPSETSTDDLVPWQPVLPSRMTRTPASRSR